LIARNVENHKDGNNDYGMAGKFNFPFKVIPKEA
jgi:hypothetical protein